MAYLAEDLSTYDFHEGAQDTELLRFEMEHQKRIGILSYRGNSEYHHGMKENSGCSTTADVLQSAVNPQIFLDERPDIMAAAQEIVDAAKLVEQEDAEDYVQDWTQSYNT